MSVVWRLWAVYGIGGFDDIAFVGDVQVWHGLEFWQMDRY